MNLRGFNSFISSSIVLTILVLLAFAMLQWLQVPTGRFIDWLVAISSFWWLLAVVTVPWNIHFQAREVLIDGAQSAERKLVVKQEQLAYVRTWARRSLAIAVALHLVSALALYALAANGVSAVGYVSAGAALLLTVLRPIARAYAYIAGRLTMIQEEFRFPREDATRLRYDLAGVEGRVESLERRLDAGDHHSWAAQQQAYAAETRSELERVRRSLNELRAANQSDHEQLAREAQGALAKIAADQQFLGHVREIIRFVKQA